MESDDEVSLLSSPIGASPPVRERRLKRLRKAIRVPTSPVDRQMDDLVSEEISPGFKALEFGDSEERLSTGSVSEDFNGGSDLDSGFDGIVGEEGGSGAKRALDFECLAEKFDEEGEDRSDKVGEEIADVVMEELEEKEASPVIEEEKDKKKMKKKKKKRKERTESDGDRNEKSKEKSSNKRRSEKERRDFVSELHAESQRLLRETRDATFKPVPLVQKPISSVLEKIRQRKLEILKKSGSVSRTSFMNYSDEISREVSVNQQTESACANESKDIRASEALEEETIACATEGDDHDDNMSKDESNDGVTRSSKIVSQMAIDEESKQVFRAPIDDTQDLFSDSQTSDSKNDTPSSPLDEVFEPSVCPLNLQFDSAPPDDVSSDDEEDYDKENIDPRPRGPVDLSLSPTGDPVKDFVDDEAEEEDDSDNDMLRFKENEEDDDDDDLEELRDMIATGFEEKPSDNEKRNELHQKWLEKQDAVGTDNLLQKLKYGSKVREPTLIEEEEEDQEGEEDEELGDEIEEELAPSNLVRMNLRKVKQMMPQMFTDNNDGYLSSDDEETEKKLSKQCLLEKADEQVSFYSPAEDESSREVFGRIKKLNIVPDTKKRAKTQTYFDMSLMGVNRSVSSKPSFVGRGSSSGSGAPSSKKQGSIAVRSFIFERGDKSSKTVEAVSEESSVTIERESRPRTVSAKFVSSQTRTFTQNSATVMNSDTSLLDILKRNSFVSKRCILDTKVEQTESVLASFKLTKKSFKSKEDLNF